MALAQNVSLLKAWLGYTGQYYCNPVTKLRHYALEAHVVRTLVQLKETYIGACRFLPGKPKVRIKRELKGPRAQEEMALTFHIYLRYKRSYRQPFSCFFIFTLGEARLLRLRSSASRIGTAAGMN